MKRLWLLFLFACAPEDRCAAFLSEASACFGDMLDADSCEQLSDQDLENLTLLAQDLDCRGEGSVLPIDGDTLAATCKATGLGCAAAINPQPRYQPTLYPIVLVNGIDVSPLFRWDDRIVRMMTQLGGQSVFLAVDPPYETPARRARALWDRVVEVKLETGAPSVNLVCHSLGGLDCRYLVSPNGLALDLGIDHREILWSIASITTVGTAHHGTRAADLALGYLPAGEDLEAMEVLASLFADAFSANRLADDPHFRESMQALTTIQMSAFNAEIVDADGVYYQSWAGFSAPGGTAPLGFDQLLAEMCRVDDGDTGLSLFLGHHDYLALPLWPTADVVGTDDPAYPNQNIPNDGLITVPSARWAHFRGCIPADHSEQLGRLDIPDVNVRTGFDVARFYTEVAADLAERGY